MMRSTRTGLAILGVIITLGVFWYDSRPEPVRTVTPDDVRAEAEAGRYRLIELPELRSLYERRLPEGLLLVDTRQDWEYRSGHIAGAMLFSMEPTWWARLRSKGKLARLLGPDRDRSIVFY